MEKVIVIIYDSPEVTDISLPVRSNWLKHLYPQIEVFEAMNGPTEVGYTKAIMQAQEDYVIDLLAGRTISHFYSSEKYGEHMSVALNAIDRRVDVQRSKYPISSTQIRADLARYSAFLDPYVLNSLMGRSA